MPQVTAPTRSDQNGQSVTHFVDSVGTTSVAYTYAVQQNELVIINQGNAAITLTVNGQSYTIQGFSSQDVPTTFTSFSVVSANGVQGFTAKSVEFSSESPQQSGGGENPFNTAEGQSVVSVSETFWARLNRLGRPVIYNGAAVAVTAVTDVNGWFNQGVLAPKSGFRLYPKKVIVSCDTDAVLVVSISTGTYVDAIGNPVYRAFCKAGTPLFLDFNGELYLDSGQMSAGVQTTATTAKMWWTIQGTEVSF